MTSEPLPEIDARISFQTSLREACLASLRVLSDSSAELLTSVGSGPKPSESCASFDPDSASLRTRQLSLLLKEDEHGTELCRDWSRSGMICGGMYFPLPRLVQGISGSESSSFVPTPTASAGGVEPDGATGRKLITVAAKAHILPTPTAADGERGGRGDLLAIARGKPNKHCNWTLPTPIANDATGSQYCYGPKVGPGKERKKFLKLPGAVKSILLPTPLARDYKDTPGMSLFSAKGRSHDDHLACRIYADESVNKTGGMRLTPEFLCWLQGYPAGWLKPLVDALATV